MMRVDLAPPRVCLLLLVDLYCREGVPIEGQLSVLSFITSQLLPYGTLTALDATPNSPHNEATLEAFKDVLSPLRRRGETSTLWEEFLTRAARINNLDMWYGFLNSIAQLFASEQSKTGPMQMTTVAGTSLFGAGIRQASLELCKLDFQDAVRHWQDYADFLPALEPDEIGLDTYHCVTNVALMDAVSKDRILEILESGRPAAIDSRNIQRTVDIERLLAFQVDQMQKLGIRMPDNVHEQLEGTLHGTATCSNLSNYIKFLDAWYAGDYSSAFENLHRYYDYAMLNKDKSQYQYALLNTAILQADFGYQSEAVAAMRETISTARENKDMSCLNFSLSWLYHFRTVYGHGIKSDADGALLASDAKSLAFLKTKAQENKMWSIVSATLLSEARLYSSQGKPPRDAIERVYESSHLNVQHGLHNMKGAQLLLYSSCFVRIGLAGLACSYRMLVSPTLIQDMSMEDSLWSRYQTSFALASTGDYQSALQLMDQVEPNIHRSLKLHQLVSSFSGMIDLKRLLHRNDLDKAALRLASLKASPLPDRDLVTQISLFELEYLERRCDVGRLLARIGQLEEQNDAEGRGSGSADVYHRMRLMSRKAWAFVRFEKPQKGLSLSIRLVVAAMEARVLPALWEGTAALAGVLISLNETEAARKLLNAVIWQAAEAEDAALLALLQATFSKAESQDAAQATAHDIRTARWRQAHAWAQKATTTYGRLEDIRGQLDVAAESAKALEQLGNIGEAAEQERLVQNLAKELQGRH